MSQSLPISKESNLYYPTKEIVLIINLQYYSGGYRSRTDDLLRARQAL